MDLKEQYEKLLRYCCMKTSDRFLAEDIVQETYLRFWQSKNYRDTGKELAYLYTIARNLCINEFKTKQSEALDENTQIVDDIRSKEPDRVIERIAIEQALSKLPEEIREIVVLKFMNEMSVSDVSKVMGISRFSVHRRLKEGLNLLKGYLEAGD